MRERARALGGVLHLRSGHLLRFPYGITTEAVTALLRALEAP